MTYETYARCTYRISYKRYLETQDEVAGNIANEWADILMKEFGYTLDEILDWQFQIREEVYLTRL